MGDGGVMPVRRDFKKQMMGPKGPIMRVMPRGVICVCGIIASLWTFPRCYLRVHEKQKERIE